MENTICNFRTIQSPNRRYANTVNLVFFKAIPLTKNFQKYVDGLKRWKEYMKDYPDSQLQVFVDQAIVDDGPIMKILGDLEARVILFECPEFLRKDGYHKGLFGTMVRFFPMFDVNTHALKVAHIQELEPDIVFSKYFPVMDKVSKSNVDASVVYVTGSIFEDKIEGFESQSKHEYGYYPWIIAGRFMAFDRVPFGVFTDYLKDVIQNKKFFNQYEDWHSSKILEHGDFSFGIDESFLNVVYLPWLIKNNRKVGILTHYKLSYPVYYSIKRIQRDTRSKELFDYILDKSQTLKQSLTSFDNLFYSRGQPSEYAKECSKRFFEVIAKYPTWLGKEKTELILKHFNGILSVICVIVFQNNKIVEVKEMLR